MTINSLKIDGWIPQGVTRMRCGMMWWMRGRSHGSERKSVDAMRGKAATGNGLGGGVSDLFDGEGFRLWLLMLMLGGGWWVLLF